MIAIFAVVVVIVIVLLAIVLSRGRAATGADPTVTPTVAVEETGENVTAYDADTGDTVNTNDNSETIQSVEGNPDMPSDPAARNGMYSAPPAMQIDPDKVYMATFETEKGDIVVELFADKVPNTVNNFRLPGP
jgi:hypothetical protein